MAFLGLRVCRERRAFLVYKGQSASVCRELMARMGVLECQVLLEPSARLARQGRLAPQALQDQPALMGRMVWTALLVQWDCKAL